MRIKRASPSAVPANLSTNRRICPAVGQVRAFNFARHHATRLRRVRVFWRIAFLSGESRGPPTICAARAPRAHGPACRRRLHPLARWLSGPARMPSHLPTTPSAPASAMRRSASTAPTKFAASARSRLATSASTASTWAGSSSAISGSSPARPSASASRRKAMPFPAPTGIVELSLRPVGTEPALSGVLYAGQKPERHRPRRAAAAQQATRRRGGHFVQPVHRLSRAAIRRAISTSGSPPSGGRARGPRFALIIGVQDCAGRPQHALHLRRRDGAAAPSPQPLPRPALGRVEEPLHDHGRFRPHHLRPVAAERRTIPPCRRQQAQLQHALRRTPMPTAAPATSSTSILRADQQNAGEVRLSRQIDEGPRHHVVHLSARGGTRTGDFGGEAVVDFGPAIVGEVPPNFPEPDVDVRRGDEGQGSPVWRRDRLSRPLARRRRDQRRHPEGAL